MNSSTVASTAAGDHVRFEFGKNWQHFLSVLNDARITQAEASLRTMLGVEHLNGQRFLDIGCGSGLFSLAARRLGAIVTSFDFDPQSVACTSELRRRYLGGDPTWVIGQGSVLDADFMRSLGTFDIVYSWGVLHHTPDTPHAIREVRRVLRPGGRSRIMIYHRRSIVGALLWLRYAVLTGRIRRSLDEVYSEHLESPGTKAYSVDAARRLFDGFSDVAVRVQLSFADLLLGEAGRRHGSGGMQLARALWPRWLLRRAAANSGLYLFIDARK